MNSFVTGMVTIAVAIVGLATIAVLVSKNANTSGVIGSAGHALATDITAAVSPVAGGFGGLASLPSLGNY